MFSLIFSEDDGHGKINRFNSRFNDPICSSHQVFSIIWYRVLFMKKCPQRIYRFRIEINQPIKSIFTYDFFRSFLPLQRPQIVLWNKWQYEYDSSSSSNTADDDNTANPSTWTPEGSVRKTLNGAQSEPNGITFIKLNHKSVAIYIWPFVIIQMINIIKLFVFNLLRINSTPATVSSSNYNNPN